MTDQVADRPQAQDGRGILAILALLSAAIHLATINAYGWFRDEFYYIACGNHLDFGYVDHPPLVALIARVTQDLLGGSLLATRLPAVLAGSAVIFLSGLLAREMGGGRFAQAVAAICALIAPVYLFVFHVFSMNSFDVLFWTLGAWIVVRIANTGNPKLWLLFGLVCGLGLQNKHSLLFFGFGVVVGLLLTPERKHFRGPWIWLGGLIAVLLFLPHVLWQVRNGWPTAEFIRNATAFKNVALSPLAFFQEQVMQMHPFTLPIWFIGLGWLLTSTSGRRYRVLGWMYAAAFLVLITQSSKAYYLAPAYPPLFAAGATAYESWAREKGRLRPLAYLIPVLVLLVGGAITAPLTLPLLPIERFPAYVRALGIDIGSAERHEMGTLPQHYADMHGWEELVAEVARVYRALPPEDRAKAGIYAQNYGDAGSIDLLGKKYGLPNASSGHNTYFHWGPPRSGEVLIIVGGDREDHLQAYRDVRQAGEIRCGLCMPYENGQAVWIARGLKAPIEQVWPGTKHYN